MLLSRRVNWRNDLFVCCEPINTQIWRTIDQLVLSSQQNKKQILLSSMKVFKFSIKYFEILGYFSNDKSGEPKESFLKTVKSYLVFCSILVTDLQCGFYVYQNASDLPKIANPCLYLVGSIAFFVTCISLGVNAKNIKHFHNEFQSIRNKCTQTKQFWIYFQ